MTVSDSAPSSASTPRGIADLKALPPIDLGLLASGVLVFIVSFFPWYGAHASGSGVGGVSLSGASKTETAWHSYSTLGLLLVLAGTILAAVVIFTNFSLPDSPVGVRWISAGLCSVGALLYVIRVLTAPHKSENLFGVKISEGIKWGGWLLLIIVLLNAAAAVISALSSDETVPWAAARGGATS